MITIGVDFHKQTSTYHVLDEKGQPLKKCKLVNGRETIRQFVSSIPGPKQLAVGVCTTTRFVTLSTSSI